MKSLVWIFPLAGIWVAGCAMVKSPAPNLIETEPQLTIGCDMLGFISETANADQLSDYLARRAMENKVKARAAALGATHIVWLHRTDASAAAQAYRCPSPETVVPEPAPVPAPAPETNAPSGLTDETLVE